MKNNKNNMNDEIKKNLGLDKDTSKPRIRSYIIWGIILLAVITLSWLWINRQSEVQVKYQTDEVKKGNITLTVSATGTLQPTNQVDVGSEISGTIKSVEVDYNDIVKAGQVLAKIDTSKLEAQIKQTDATLESAKAKLLQSKATVTESRVKLARLLQVYETSGGKVPSKTDIDTAKATLDRSIADEKSAEASINQSQASLEAQRTDLSKSFIKSPINGMVLTRSAEPGQTVAATFQTPVLFTIAEDLTQMELHVDVDEADVGKLKDMQQAVFTVDAYPDRIFPANITQVRYGSKTVSGVVTYETILKVNNEKLLLRPGMTATANITVDKRENVIVVANAALRFNPPAQNKISGSGGRGFVGMLLPRPPSSSSSNKNDTKKEHPHVWILNNEKLEKIIVKTGVTDGIITEIKDDKLKPGMILVTDMLTVK